MIKGYNEPNTAVWKASSAIIALMFLAIIAVLSVWLVSSYKSTIHRGDERVTAAAKIVSANAIWMNSLARETLHRIDDGLGRDFPQEGNGHAHDLNAAISELPSQVTAYVLGPDGRTLFSNDPDIKQVDVTDREYFFKLRNGAEEYTSALLNSRLSDKQIFVFSRRLEREGRFAGAAVVAFDASILRTVWDSIALGDNSTVSLIRRDGHLVARHPEPDGPVNMKDYILFTDYMRHATTGVYRAFSPIDGQNRLVAYKIIERTPFVAIASADDDVVMQPFWESVEIAGALVILAVIGAIAAAIWIRGLISADATHTRQLAAALEANAVLMREIHHRVKNNLQTAMALIRMQGFDPEAVERLNERIAAMSAVHEQMYGFDQFQSVPAQEFIPAFVQRLVNTYDRSVRLDFDIDQIYIAADKATPLALLINELIANTMKYAFAEGTGGEVRVELKRASHQQCDLIVADNGKGYDGMATAPGMGSRLIKAFVGQLGGSFTYKVSGGTKFTANLKLQ